MAISPETGGCSSVFSSSLQDEQASDHFDGRHYFNPGGTPAKGFLDVLKWQLSGGKKKWPSFRENTHKPQLNMALQENEVAATFVNHAMVLLQFQGFNVLTDPHLSERASPFSWIGPKRVRAPGVSFEELPKIEAIMVSHNHYDHLDLPTLKKIADRDQPLILVPLGDKKLLESVGIKNVQEVDWWQTVQLNPSLQIIFTPCHHWSARGLFDRNKSLWGSFTLNYKGAKMHFGGDTGYSAHFKMIYQKLGAMQFSMLPIGAYEPRWFMKEQHMNPEEAVQAHLDLHSKKSMGIHFGTFQLTDEGIDEPVIALKDALKKHNISESEFMVMGEGETQKILLKD